MKLKNEEASLTDWKSLHRKVTCLALPPLPPLGLPVSCVSETTSTTVPQFSKELLLVIVAR